MCPVATPTDPRRGPGAPDFDVWRMTMRRTRRTRPRCRRPARCFRPTIRVMAACRRAGLFRPRRSRPPVRSFRPTIRAMAGPLAHLSIRTARPIPTGPILSPDDPRYGRPAAPPPVIYADRPPGSQQSDSDRGDSRIPGAGIVYPNDDRAAVRPPEAVGAAPARPLPESTPAAATAPVGADGKPVQLSALPPDEQPEAAPSAAAAQFTPPGSGVRDQGASRVR